MRSLSVTAFKVFHSFFISPQSNTLQLFSQILSETEVRFAGVPMLLFVRESKSSLRVHHSRRAFSFSIQEIRSHPYYDDPQRTPRPRERGSRRSQTEISEAQLAANRANAQFSTGATSEAGKKKVSLNALKTGLTGRQVLLPEDAAAIYEAMVRDYQSHFRNLALQENRLVRRRERETKELRELQAIRKAAEAEKAKNREKPSQTTAPAPNGFVFSTAQITDCIAVSH